MVATATPLLRRATAFAGGVALTLGALLSVPTAAQASTDYGPAAWVPASTSNYTNASRESDYNINYVVIHTVQGSYTSAINWFQNPAAQVSAHYVVSKGGAVTQMVREADVAWHAGNWTYNTQSIGIEHEGYVEQDGWYTEAMYQASAAIVRSVTSKYGIPRDRAHIIGHNEVPGATHTDPGNRWNWSYFMQLVNGTTPPPSWTSTVDNTTAGRFTASANWGTSSYSAQRYGADYRYANPAAVSDAAWYKFNIPATASYRVEVWYPAVAGYNTTTPYVIATTGGNQTVQVNQQSGGGAWVNLGTFSLAAGDYNAVGVSRWSGGAGYVIADAVKLTRV
ncbi:golvesin C-terminal-like domain-containing protein [Catellatospora vulcania]|uniref:golvesin C-terminal-like domain-containing protein n=1 Tax=Catellatospora vulcania TaxID=1460450 RepID=UPI0012D3F95A|nr:N-acetylmuramoyl-L-alanine amidase [Catellatospora vulcania]